MLVNIILWMVFGALMGWGASVIIERNSQMGAIPNILVGIVGASITGFLMDLFDASDVSSFNLYSLVVATMGAVILLFLIGLTQQNEATL